MITTSNKMACGRNLRWRPIHGGHASHEQTSLENNFGLSEAFLEGSGQAATTPFFDLPDRSDLPGQIPLDPGNCRSLRRRQYRWASPLYKKCSSDRGKTRTDNYPMLPGGFQGLPECSFDSRRYSGSTKRKKYPGPRASSFQPRTDQGFVCRDRDFESRPLESGLCSSRIQTQKSLRARNLQKQGDSCAGNSWGSIPLVSSGTYGCHGHLVWLRSHSQYDSGGGRNFRSRSEAKSICLSESDQNIRVSSGQETDGLLPSQGFREKVFQDRFANRLAVRSRADQTFYFPHGRLSFLCHQQSGDDRIRDGQDLHPTLFHRDFSQRHQTAFGFRRNG